MGDVGSTSWFPDEFGAATVQSDHRQASNSILVAMSTATVLVKILFFDGEVKDSPLH